MLLSWSSRHPPGLSHRRRVSTERIRSCSSSICGISITGTTWNWPRGSPHGWRTPHIPIPVSRRRACTFRQFCRRKGKDHGDCCIPRNGVRSRSWRRKAMTDCGGARWRLTTSNRSAANLHRTTCLPCLVEREVGYTSIPGTRMGIPIGYSAGSTAARYSGEHWPIRSIHGTISSQRKARSGT